MSAASRIAPSALFTPQAWAPLQTRSAWFGPLLVAHCWAVIALAVVARVLIPWLIPLCIMIVGTRQLGLSILLHEAAHGGLSKSPRLNEFRPLAVRRADRRQPERLSCPAGSCRACTAPSTPSRKPRPWRLHPAMPAC